MNELCVEITDFSNAKLIGSNVGLFSDEEPRRCGSVAHWEIDSVLLKKSIIFYISGNRNVPYE